MPHELSDRDLIWDGGSAHALAVRTRRSSATTPVPRVIDARADRMREVLAEVRDGSFAREWIADMDSGEPRLGAARAAAGETRIEQVGAELRALMHRAEERSGVG